MYTDNVYKISKKNDIHKADYGLDSVYKVYKKEGGGKMCRKTFFI